MTLVGITRRPTFWLALTMCAGLSTLFTFKYFPQAFSIVHLDVKINRRDALAAAKKIAEKHAWGPKDYSQAASFETDSLVKTFVELEAGGKDAFTKMLTDDLYEPYTWHVRHFKEQEKNETTIVFTPEGTRYGFAETLSEDTPGAALSSQEARIIAENSAQKYWPIDLDEYESIETSKEKRPSKRIDHTFVYERPNIKIGKGRYRLRLSVSGDKLTEVIHFIKVPEEFILRYKEMRSFNNTLAMGASFLMMLLYILGGCLFGIVWLMRKRLLLWRTPLMWGLLIGILNAGLSLNQLPLAWMHYNTDLSMQTFFMSYLVSILSTLVFSSLYYSLIFMAAEGLTRAAFGNQLQLWKVWSRKLASSLPIAGKTIGGYLLVPFMLAFVVLFYLITTTFFGWWTPSDALINPNVLATYLPWFSSIAISLQAGFMEECLFRAVPLAAAALIGQRSGKRTQWIIFAFILQAFIFGAAHANYPAQPFYARMVELIIPSFVWGGIYLGFGLLPGIIAHFAYDVFWFSLPLFISTASHAWINQIIVIFLASIPLLIVIWKRAKHGSWLSDVSPFLNAAWQPPIPAETSSGPHEPIVSKPFSLNKIVKTIIYASGIFGVALFFIGLKYHQDAPLFILDRTLAEKHAEFRFSKTDAAKNAWRTLSTVRAHYKENQSETLQHRFIWQEGDKALYKKLLGTYLQPPHWTIRFVRFDGSVSERAEEYQFLLDSNAKLLRHYHKLPETMPGKQLSEDEARTFVHEELQKHHLKLEDLKEISAVANKLPDRKDWTFTFAHQKDYSLQQGEARIVIEVAGDKIVDGYRYIHVPEKWERRERNKIVFASILSMLCSLLFYIFLGMGIFFAARASHKPLSRTTALFSFVGSIVLYAITFTNMWPSLLFSFNTSEPFYNQLFMICVSSSLGILFISMSLSSIISLIHTQVTPFHLKKGTTKIMSSISLGFLATGISLALRKWSPSLEPMWSTSYNAYSGLSPILGIIISTLTNYVWLTSIFILTFIIMNTLSDHWRKKRLLTIFILILFGIVATGLTPAIHIGYWLLSGTIIGVLLSLVYALFARFEYSFVPLAAAIYTAAHSIQEIIFVAHPSETSSIVTAYFALTDPLVWGHIGAIAAVGCLAWIWFSRLQRY